MTNKLTQFLVDEWQAHRKGGLYHKTQVQLAYNSNRIEGSKLTEDQTRYIFETRTIGFKDQEAVPVDDIIETTNHFVAFDHLLRTINEPLTEDLIKDFHRILKTGTADAQKAYFNVGDWKKLANEVGGHDTCRPADVEKEMCELRKWYSSQTDVTILTLAEYHWRFESIHPFRMETGVWDALSSSENVCVTASCLLSLTMSISCIIIEASLSSNKLLVSSSVRCSQHKMCMRLGSGTSTRNCSKD